MENPDEFMTVDNAATRLKTLKTHYQLASYKYKPLQMGFSRLNSRCVKILALGLAKGNC